MASTNVQSKTNTSKEPSPAILPLDGFVRLQLILHVFPVSKSTWWNGVKSGRFPAPVRLGPNTVAWKAKSVRDLIESFEKTA
jgi:prophage regulatory protein